MSGKRCLKKDCFGTGLFGWGFRRWVAATGVRRTARRPPKGAWQARRRVGLRQPAHRNRGSYYCQGPRHPVDKVCSSSRCEARSSQNICCEVHGARWWPNLLGDARGVPFGPVAWKPSESARFRPGADGQAAASLPSRREFQVRVISTCSFGVGGTSSTLKRASSANVGTCSKQSRHQCWC